MTSGKLVVVAFALALLASCGGANAHPVSVIAVASASASAAPVVASPPIDLARYWLFEDRAEISAYADLHGLLGTTLGSAFEGQALLLLGNGQTAERRDCLKRAIASVREIVFAQMGDRHLVLARYDMSFDPGECLVVWGMTSIALDGAPKAYGAGDEVVASMPGVLVGGEAQVVEAALRVATGARALPSKLALVHDEYASFFGHDENTGEISGSLLASDTRFRIRVHADVGEDTAKSVERMGHEFLDDPKLPSFLDDENAVVARIAKMVTLTRSRGFLDGALDLEEPPLDQARDLGLVAGVAVRGLRRYVRDAKLTEKKIAIDTIAKDYAEWWRHDDGTPRARRKLLALPPVPSDVPRSAKYQSAPDDWRPWNAIGYSMAAPQYFQYSVEVATGGMSGSIVARGDLNGDGVDSIYRREFHIDARHAGDLVMAPDVTATNPEE